jgi:hypothetical protein
MRSASDARPFFALARILTRAAGPPALLRAAPPFAAVALISAVLFGGNGMRPRDLVGALAGSTPARASLWAAWILLTAPAARALLSTPSTFGLRALPVPRGWFWAVHGAHLVALQAPWIVLFGLGGGATQGLGAALAGAAAGALAVAGPRTAREVAAALALGAAVVAGAPPFVLVPAAAASGAVGVAAAWTRAPERGNGSGLSIVSGWSAWGALVLAHVAVLGRRDATTLIRGAAVALVGALVLALALRNNGVAAAADREAIALAAGALPLALATGGVGVKVVETERRLEWLLLATASSARLRALAATGVTAAWGALAGAIYGGGAAIGSDGSLAGRARLAMDGVVLGASLGAAAAHGARRADQTKGVDGTAVVVAMTAAAAAVVVLAAWAGAAALAPLAVAAAWLGATTVRLLAARERRSDRVVSLPWEDA